EPFFDPGGALRDGELIGTPEHHQSEGMLAGKFAGGAAAFAGHLDEIDLHLIGFCAAALAFAPDGGVVAAGADPFARAGESLAGLRAGRVGGELKNPFDGPTLRHGGISVGARFDVNGWRWRGA